MKLHILGYQDSTKFRSSGVAKRPADCNSCKLNYLTTGFVPDKVPSKPRVAFLLLAPYADDANERLPLAGNMGYVVKNLSRECGLDYDKDVIVSYIIRCFAPLKSEARDPNRKLKKTYLEQGCYNCRAYDYFKGNSQRELIPGGIADWNPTHYIPTYEFGKIFEQPAYKILITTDIKKAVEASAEGKRPVVIFGSEAAKLVLPWVEEGGIKMWRGSLEEWTWKPSKAPEPPKGFKALV